MYILSPKLFVGSWLIAVQIAAGVELNWALFAEFEWKITAVTTPDQEQAGEEANGARLISQFEIEITLIKHLHPNKLGVELNNTSFTADVLRSRLFHLRLEEGKFAQTRRQLRDVVLDILHDDGLGDLDVDAGLASGDAQKVLHSADKVVAA